MNSSRLILKTKRDLAINKILKIQCLTDRCNSFECKWLNEDGFRGCYDLAIMQIDHILGDGSKERKLFSGVGMYDFILAAPEELIRKKYQMLCANCHLIKTNRENAFRLSGLLVTNAI